MKQKLLPFLHLIMFKGVNAWKGGAVHSCFPSYLALLKMNTGNECWEKPASVIHCDLPLFCPAISLLSASSTRSNSLEKSSQIECSLNCKLNPGTLQTIKRCMVDGLCTTGTATRFSDCPAWPTATAKLQRLLEPEHRHQGGPQWFNPGSFWIRF